MQNSVTYAGGQSFQFPVRRSQGRWRVGGGADGKQCDRILVTVTLGQTDVTFNSEISDPRAST